MMCVKLCALWYKLLAPAAVLYETPVSVLPPGQYVLGSGGPSVGMWQLLKVLVIPTLHG